MEKDNSTPKRPAFTESHPRDPFEFYPFVPEQLGSYKPKLMEFVPKPTQHITYAKNHTKIYPKFT